MAMKEDDFEIRPGRSRDQVMPANRKATSLVGQVLKASRRSGATPLARRNGKFAGTGRFGRGRIAALLARRSPYQRRVVIKARVVRHKGVRFRAAPLALHISYLERDGVMRDQQRGEMFDAGADAADGDAFAERCADDRHHFRFIVSPEDAAELADLRAFTRELMDDMARDLGTRLDWVAVDHWNTDNPHVHVLVRGKASDGADIVIDRDYIREGMRARAEERVTIELGPRSERDMQRAMAREVSAERWTGLDRQLRSIQDRKKLIDLRPAPGQDRRDHSLLVGRVNTLVRMGLADETQQGLWTMRANAEQTLRDLEIRGDIIKTIHRSMAENGWRSDLSRLAIHDQLPPDPIIGRLVSRGLHDELSGRAYAVVDGIDGRTHHLRFNDLGATGDARPGAIVELRQWTDRKGQSHAGLTVRSDLGLAEQVTAKGATWLDQQLVAKEPPAHGSGFGREVEEALKQRAEHLAEEGLATRHGRRFVFARGLLETLRRAEISAAAKSIFRQTGLELQPSGAGQHVSGIYRQRVDLASGRFAMIDNGLGFQLVPWQPVLERKLGQAVTGAVNQRGGVDWSFTRSRSVSL
jgi:type IV secretory pathway VirD2 relaxase